MASCYSSTQGLGLRVKGGGQHSLGTWHGPTAQHCGHGSHKHWVRSSHTKPHVVCKKIKYYEAWLITWCHSVFQKYSSLITVIILNNSYTILYILFEFFEQASQRPENQRNLNWNLIKMFFSQNSFIKNLKTNVVFKKTTINRTKQKQQVTCLFWIETI